MPNLSDTDIENNLVYKTNFDNYNWKSSNPELDK